jgi:Na+/H+ antiporter NhaD/arsenite permease-like protein
MTLDAALTLIILIATLVILASQRLRPDLTALCVTLALILTGVLSPAEAFSAFAQPVIIIIPCIFILGAALYETGVATLIANQLMRVGTQNPVVLVLVIMLTAGLLSSVVTSMLIIAVLMPAVLRIARRARLAPSLLLLPLVSGATMGNLLTLIGAISHLVVSDLLVVSGYEPLGFFSLTPIGLASLIAAPGDAGRAAATLSGRGGTRLPFGSSTPPPAHSLGLRSDCPAPRYVRTGPNLSPERDGR